MMKSAYNPGVQVDAPDILCLHRNENLFVDERWMAELMRENLDAQAIAKYPEPTALPVRKALAKLYGVAPENVFVGNGSDEVLANLLALLRRRFDSLGTLDVCFKIYDMLVERYEFQRRVIPGDTFHTGRIEAKGWRGLAVVDSPNAITANRLAWDELRRLAESPDAFLIWDNAYGEFAGDELPADLPGNAVWVRSFSKFYAMAGLRVGYCIGDAELIGELLARKDAFNVNGFGQQMAMAALLNRERFAEWRREIVSCRQELVSRLRLRGFASRESGGNYVLATHRALPARHLQEELLRRRIAVRRFAGPPTDDYIRITVPPLQGIDQLTSALDDILTPAAAQRPEFTDVR